MASYREFMNDCLASCKCRGELKAKSDAEVLVGKLCEKLDEMGGAGIKTVVIKGVYDETTKKMVYTPNMTYEEARDVMLNLEPFNVIWIERRLPSGTQRKLVVRAVLESDYITLGVLGYSSSELYRWSAAGIAGEPM